MNPGKFLLLPQNLSTCFVGLNKCVNLEQLEISVREND